MLPGLQELAESRRNRRQAVRFGGGQSQSRTASPVRDFATPIPTPGNSPAKLGRSASSAPLVVTIGSLQDHLMRWQRARCPGSLPALWQRRTARFLSVK